MSINLFKPELPAPQVFSEFSTQLYYDKIKKANPRIPLIEAIETSKNMIKIFHEIMCYIVLKFLKDELLIQEIHEEGHAFKIKFRNKCPGKDNDIYGVSLSVNAYDNDNIKERSKNMDYVITCCLNDKDSKIHYDENIEYGDIKKINESNFKETVKKVLQELNKISTYSKESNRKEEISEFVDEVFRDIFGNRF